MELKSYYCTMQVKICGITRLSDALHAISHGVGWLGFNFVPGSKRFIAPAEAADIVASLPPGIRSVGVFMDQDESSIRSVLSRVPLDTLQFHGKEPPELLARFGTAIIKAFAVDSSFDPTAISAYGAVADYYLFDSKVAGQTGGTGHAFDWNLLPECGKPFFLAGGIGADNAVAAVGQAAPWALDLNSKLESAPGIKNPSLVTKCLEQLKAAGFGATAAPDRAERHRNS